MYVTERNMDGACCKLYRVRSQSQNINSVVPKFIQEILDSQRNITQQLFKSIYTISERKHGRVCKPNTQQKLGF
jgi:hypothetical protein